MTKYKVTYQTSTTSRIDTAYLTASCRMVAMDQVRDMIANVINIVTIDEA